VSELVVAMLLVLLVGLAVSAVRSSDLFVAAVSLGAYGFVMSLVWAAIGALDVAFTEAVVGAGATTVLLLATLLRTTPRATPAPRALAALALLAGVALVGALAVFAGDLPPFGDAASPASLHVSPRYLMRTLEETATPNAVTSVLADYRSYDTLIETTVIVTAGLGCWLLLAPRRS
jgi:multicomponent Na+:H+ antiporter subunit B